MAGEARATALLAAAHATQGFLPEDEAMALHEAAARAARASLGPLVEIGSYLGRSALFIAAAIAASGTDTLLYSVDHHRGSEEMQAGWEHHDASLVDASGQMNSLGRFRTGLENAGATDLVIGVLGDSARIAAHWPGSVGLVFIDGGHGDAIEWADYVGWTPHLPVGGRLVIHDVFEDPRDGGRSPYRCYRDALDSGAFEEEDEVSCASLRVLIRRVPGANTEAVGPPTSTSAASTTAAAE
jgi:MMP 1-O-methyltransferase